MALDVYLVKFLVGNTDMPGAPLLHVTALVDAPTGRISGHAEITQAVAPPAGDIRIDDVTGRIRSLSFDPALRVVTLSGSYRFSFPPPAIGEGTASFSAVLVLDANSWNGRGSFSYGGHHVENVPVRPEAE